MIERIIDALKHAHFRLYAAIVAMQQDDIPTASRELAAAAERINEVRDELREAVDE